MAQPQTWLIADTHFFHTNIIKYCNRPFSSTEEMNKTLITNWNGKVRAEDTVFVLGDFALAGKDDIIKVGQKLNGRKTLVLGNHDGASMTTYYEAGFEFISKYPIIYKEFYILSHEPQYVQEGGVYLNIFGHVHNNPMYKTASERSYCCSVERIDYKPILFDEIVATAKSIEEANKLSVTVKYWEDKLEKGFEHYE